jgi:hypothetical protein
VTDVVIAERTESGRGQRADAAGRRTRVERRTFVVEALRSARPLAEVAVEHGITVQSARRLIRRELAARLPRLAGALDGPVGRPVEIVRDRYGIPHVFAETEEDVYVGLGYAVAQDRLWQLEYRRRWAYGTLAEVLGPSAVASDKAARTLRFDRIAEVEHAEHPPETRRLLEAYACGVNAAIAAFGDTLPIEFDVLGIRPSPWRAVNTVTIARASLWQFSGRIENIVIGEAETRLLPPELVARFLAVGAPSESILPPHPSLDETLTPTLSRGRGKLAPLPPGEAGVREATLRRAATSGPSGRGCRRTARRCSRATATSRTTSPRRAMRSTWPAAAST